MEEPATLKQRIALTNMYTRLKWGVRGIRDMTKAEASEAFERANKEFQKRLSHGGKGFGYRDNASDHSGYNDPW